MCLLTCRISLSYLYHEKFEISLVFTRVRGDPGENKKTKINERRKNLGLSTRLSYNMVIGIQIGNRAVTVSHNSRDYCLCIMNSNHWPFITVSNYYST